ncbi:MAG: reverse transcriptase family protein [Gammaproteobacteria bacterium]|nr:reverse transcriptase family protein [Gammaproteobacteria bacterium]
MCGFLKGHSCETALLPLTQECRKCLDAHLPAAVVSLDLSKAFDMVHHQLLLAKLASFGLCNNSVALLRSYLEGRSARVKLGDNLSRPVLLDRGVPQGSILGPLLFNIYVTDLSWLLLKCRLIRYADDTTLLLSARTWADVVSSLNCDLVQMSEWFTANYLTLNAGKTQAMAIYNRPPAALSTVGKIVVNGVPTEWLSSLKMLGVTLNPNVDLSQHALSIKRRAAFSLSLLRQLRRILSQETLCRLYCQYVRSLLEFSSILLVSCSPVVLEGLERFQRSALRQLLGMGRRTNPLPVCGIPSLSSRRNARLLRLVFQCVRTGSPNYLAVYFTVTATTYNLRGQDRLVVPQSRTEAMKRSFAATGIRLWNGLDNVTRQLSWAGFQSFLQQSDLSCE